MTGAFAIQDVVMGYQRAGVPAGADGDGLAGDGADGVVALGADGLLAPEPLVEGGVVRVAGVDMSRFAAVCELSSRPVVNARNRTTTAKMAAATHPHVAFDDIESSGGRFCMERRSGSFGS
jgi:hypothetical protein